jgi:hypothetical protein
MASNPWRRCIVPTTELASPRTRAATFAVAVMMALSTASFAALALLWQDGAPLTGAPPAESREATGNPIGRDTNLLERTPARAGKWT